VLVAIASSSDFWKVGVICLFKFSPESIVAGVGSVFAKCGLPCCCPKCLFEVFYVGCAEVSSWWLVAGAVFCNQGG
jgi:hypothetical protein